MEKTANPPGLSLIVSKAGSYLADMQTLIDKSSDWWSYVEGPLDERLGTTVDKSVEAAKEVLEAGEEAGAKKLSDLALQLLKRLQKVYDAAAALESHYLETKAEKDAKTTHQFAAISYKYKSEVERSAQLLLPGSKSNVSEQTTDESSSQQGSYADSGFQDSKEVSLIKRAQLLLRTVGINRLAPDGILGPATAEAIRNFQRSANLEPTGNPDEKTLELLERTAANRSSEYWLIKFNPKNWDFDGLPVGRQTWYHTEGRPDYDRFLSLQPGHQLVGYDFVKAKNVVCLFTVMSVAHQEENLGEVVPMKISKKFSAPLEIEPLRDRLSLNWTELESGSPFRLMPLTEDDFNLIVKAHSRTTKKSPQPREINPFYVAEGDHANTDDQLKFKEDIYSLASVISLKNVDPPLAIGLFGHWGSGKSFFMQKLQERINELVKLGGDYVTSVVHVKFNSWHYSDTNLWACLITELFDSLGKGLKGGPDQDEMKRLTSTLRLTAAQQEAAEKKARELEGKIETLQQNQERERKQLEDVSGVALIKQIARGPKINGELGKWKGKALDEILGSNDQLGEKELVEQKEQLGEIIKAATETKENLWKIWPILKTTRGWRWLIIAFVLILVFGGSALVKRYFLLDVQSVFKWLAAILTIVVPYITRFRKVHKQINAGLVLMVDQYDRIASRAPAQSGELNKELANLQKVTENLTDLGKRIENTKTEIVDIRSGRRLMEFIDERIKDESYSKQLGLISWIRRDFSRLDDLLRKQHVKDDEADKVLNPENVTLKIDRIVLYIDDLDRCNTEVVVKVLEAVHLLLAFPLFVVVVGVDPRWLNNALEEKYKALLRGSKNHKGPTGKTSQMARSSTANTNHEPTEEELLLSGVATTYDYLEKIFQIPFTLKPIEDGGRRKLIKYLAKKGLEAPAPSVPGVSKPIASPQSPPDIPGPVPVAAPSTKDPAAQAQQNSASATGSTTTSAPKAVVDKPPPKEKLVFIPKELEFMESISSIFGHTPRSINRYVNIYRIIKSHSSFRVTNSYSEDDFMPVMVVLSIVVGHPVLAQELIDRLKNGKDTITMVKFLRAPGLTPQLKKLLLTSVNKRALGLKLSFYKRNLELISRFSFRTIQM